MLVIGSRYFEEEKHMNNFLEWLNKVPCWHEFAYSKTPVKKIISQKKLPNGVTRTKWRYSYHICQKCGEPK
jgi:hypothetical protein